MYRIALINMPFAALSLPSIGLTQLKSILHDEFKDEVSVEIRYINQDFGRLLGVELYTWIALSGEAHNSGMGDWFFRQAAFPSEPDNAQEYFRRFFPSLDARGQAMKSFLLAQRGELNKVIDSLIARYRLDQAQVVGFTSMFNQNVASFAVARRLKEINPQITTVMGGANCETPMGKELIEDVFHMDYIFSGSALKSFPQFVRHGIAGDSDGRDRVKGVFSKRNTAGAGRSLPLLDGAGAGGCVGEELDINTYIELSYGEFLDGLEKNFPNNEVEPILLFETSRGCWWGEKAHCTFCGLNGQNMGYRSMEAETAIKLIRSMLSYYPRCKRFNCVDNIMPKSYVREVFQYVDAPQDACIFYEVKADLSEDDLQTLSKARVKVVQPGIESLATSTLKLMKKGTRSFQNLALLKNCVMYDITPTWNLLVGFPGEQEEVYKKYVRDLPLLTHLPPPDGVFPVRFDRYSPYFMKAKEYRLELEPVDYYDMIYPVRKEAKANLAYYFTDRNLNADYFLAMARWIDKVREKFSYWKTRWGREDNKLAPQLFIKKSEPRDVVFDSRSGEAIEHRLGDAGLRLLQFLDKPKRLADVAEELSDVPHLDASAEIARLQELGLIFEESGCYISLVLPRQPGRLSYNTGF